MSNTFRAVGIAIMAIGIGLGYFIYSLAPDAPDIQFAFADDTGAQGAGTVTTTNTTCSDNMNWTLPTGTTELQSNDTTYVSYSGNSWDSGNISDGVYASNFGFSTSGTIDGIQVEIFAWTTANTASYTDVVLSTSVDNRVGDDKGTGSWETSDNDTYASFGGSADHWNAGLTSAQVNASTFGVEICSTAGANNTRGNIDHVRITITYTPAAGEEPVQQQSVYFF